MSKLLLATSNAGKVAEYRMGLAGLPLELISLAELGLALVEETGATLEENALLKARSYFAQSALLNGGQGIPCIADDGGLEIDFLHGAPGVKSRRWKTGDETATDQELVDYTIEQMREAPEGERAARFRMVMAFVDAAGNEHLVEESCEGVVPLAASTVVPHGLPFNAVLYIPQFGKIRSELSKEEHELVNQRMRAMQKLRPTIAKSITKALRI